MSESKKLVIQFEDRPAESVKKGRQLAREVGGMTKGLSDEDTLAIWRWQYLDLANKLANGNLSMTDRRNALIGLGIATEKMMLLAGRPTQLIANIHEHRHNLAGIAAKLAEVQRIIDADEVKALPSGHQS